MAWFRTGGGGIPSSLKSDMNDVFNKKFGTVLQDYPPEDWPGTVNLMGPLPEKTVSGSVVAFSDGADDVPLKSCAVTIAPTLDGVSSVDVVSAGKNLCPIPTSETIGNVTFTVNTDGSISVSGTNDGSRIIYYMASNVLFKAGNYVLSGCPSGGGSQTWELEIYPSGTSTYYRDYGSGKALTLTEDTLMSFAFVVRANQTTNFTIYPMLEVGSTATAYAPYVQPTTHTANLGRTIYGGSVDVENGTGTDEYIFDLWDGTQNYNVSDNLTNVFRIYMAHAKPLPDPTAVQCICEGYTFPRAGWSSDTVSFYSDDNNFALKLPKTEVTTLAEAKAWLAEHNVYFLYATTPEDFTFTPVSIISRLGDNTMWGDGDLSVTYRRDIDLALAQ